MEPPTAKHSILIDDDSPANLTLLSEVLREDYRVRLTTSGETALQIAASDSPPDLILLDVVMPGLNGYEVSQRLKQQLATRHIPVIFVSALHEVDEETKGLELGGVDYVSKPVGVTGVAIGRPGRAPLQFTPPVAGPAACPTIPPPTRPRRTR